MKYTADTHSPFRFFRIPAASAIGSLCGRKNFAQCRQARSSLTGNRTQPSHLRTVDNTHKACASFLYTIREFIIKARSPLNRLIQVTIGRTVVTFWDESMAGKIIDMGGGPPGNIDIALLGYIRSSFLSCFVFISVSILSPCSAR